MRRWSRLIAWFSLSGLALFVLAWSFLLYAVEWTNPFSGAPLPTCTASADENFIKAIASARDHIQAMMTDRGIPGLAVAAAVNGKIVWSEAFGYSDLKRELPACPETQFRIASVSKLVTAAAAMRLYEKGKLDLDAPIQTYVPDFPDKGHTITSRQLLSHRGGIRDYRNDNEAINTTSYTSAAKSLEKFKDDPLMFVPDADSDIPRMGLFF